MIVLFVNFLPKAGEERTAEGGIPPHFKKKSRPQDSENTPLFLDVRIQHLNDEQNQREQREKSTRLEGPWTIALFQGPRGPGVSLG